MGIHGLVLALDGAAPAIDESAFIAPGATVVGNVTIGRQSNVWYGCVLRGDVDEIRIGAGTSLQDGTIVHGSAGAPTVVGSRVLVGHGALLHGCEIEDCALIGMRAVALNGSRVESGGVLAAGAVLTEGSRVPSGETWAGVPARRLAVTDSPQLERIGEQADQYIAIAQRHDLALVVHAQAGAAK